MRFRLGSRLRIRSVASLVPFALAAFFVAPTPAAYAASCGPVTAGDVVAATPYLSTAYGPIAHGVQASSGAWGAARPGLYSPLTGGFNPTGSNLAVVNASWGQNWSVASSDGVNAVFCGYVILSSPYGQVVYGVQYSGSQGRWGNFNRSSNLFYPDNGGWHPLA
ncbi:hypothetical protein CC117_16610 [Parafrankia colletiae]|uniref:Uncharacterized protein n=1 Tax=Parafrankia colletiae TaxID=573497 RepID=A0A1S1QVH9_9ACTN|nr:hypothetical protein [Frankia sp. Cpl3]OHV37606.1 hypothetical protein CC117_16610 [Parafrankia colletiae]